MDICFENYQKLVIKCMIVFQVSLNFDPVKEILKIIQCQWRKWLFWGKYFWQWCISFHHSPTQKETKYSRFNWRFITYSIRIRNLDWYKCRYCKNEAREIDCSCCREVDATLIASAKIPEHEGSISPSSF